MSFFRLIIEQVASSIHLSVYTCFKDSVNIPSNKFGISSQLLDAVDELGTWEQNGFQFLSWSVEFSCSSMDVNIVWWVKLLSVWSLAPCCLFLPFVNVNVRKDNPSTITIKRIPMWIMPWNQYGIPYGFAMHEWIYKLNVGEVFIYGLWSMYLNCT